MLDQLEFQKGSDDYWRKWSIDHAKQARVLWPAIQELAQRELYILRPELFELAQLDLKPAELDAQIDQLLRDRYHGLILDMKAADRVELARQLLDEALADYPDDERLMKLRSELPPSSDIPPTTPTPK